MALPEDGHLLRIFIGESDRHNRQPLYQWIVREARRVGLAGATVLRGIEGFGGRSRLHTAKFLRLSSDLPVIFTTSPQSKVDLFWDLVDAMGLPRDRIKLVNPHCWVSGLWHHAKCRANLQPP